MVLDIQAQRLNEIFAKRDVKWLDPPNPTWRMQPPSTVKWLLSMGWRAPSYEQRFVQFLRDILETWPESYVTYDEAPQGLKGDWQEVNLDTPNWRSAETGAYLRAIDRKTRVWKIPPSADPEEMLHWLHKGAWSIWKPTRKATGVPRHLAQSTFKTVVELGYEFLVTSSWENQFTELSINPEVASKSAAA